MVDKIWTVIINSLMKRCLTYGSDDVDMTFETQDGMKVTFKATNVQIKVEKE